MKRKKRYWGYTNFRYFLEHKGLLGQLEWIPCPKRNLTKLIKFNESKRVHVSSMILPIDIKRLVMSHLSHSESIKEECT